MKTTSIKVTGITKVKDEAHIIEKTLNNWSQYCDTIHVYDDCSGDDTAEICRQHPKVVEVVSSTLYDFDRLRAEWYNRQVVLQSAKRFNPDWIAYFDADEWLYGFDKDVLKTTPHTVVAARFFDVYITPEDEHTDFAHRRWVGPEYRDIPLFFKNSRFLRFSHPDQRIMSHDSHGQAPLMMGVVKHFGKGISVEQWEKKCRYYGYEFGKYADKWQSRFGKAVKRDFKSDFGNDLVTWESISDVYCSRVALA